MIRKLLWKVLTDTCSADSKDIKNRDPPIMLIIGLTIMQCCTAQKFTYYA